MSDEMMLATTRCARSSEGEAYGARLAEAGQLIRCEMYAGSVHDWYLHIDWAGVDEFWEELGREVRAHFDGAHVP